MAEAPAPQSDRDLASIAEARALARLAKKAWLELAEFSQERIDAIVDAMATAATSSAEAFARLAVEETGFGVVDDKIQKNLFASQKVYGFIRPMKILEGSRYRPLVRFNPVRSILEVFRDPIYLGKVPPLSHLSV